MKPSAFHSFFASNLPENKHMPSTTLNTTTEKVPRRSNNPNTLAGSNPVPIGPINIAVRQMPAQIPSDFCPAFFAPSRISASAAREKMTTSTVTSRCITFCGAEFGASDTHGKQVYPTLQSHSIAAKQYTPKRKRFDVLFVTATHTAIMETRARGRTGCSAGWQGLPKVHRQPKAH